MAVKRRFSFHVSSDMSDEQIKAGLASYQSDNGESPDGWYLKTGDVLEVEMLVTDMSQVDTIAYKLQEIFKKVTAKPVIAATELGPVPEGTTVPLPETSVRGGAVAEGFANATFSLTNFFGNASQWIVLAVVGVIALIIILRVSK